MEQTNPNSLANLAKGAEIRAQAMQEKKQAFLAHLPECWPNIAEAAKRAGWSRSMAFVERQRDETFRRAWEDIVETRVDQIENRLIDAGLNDRGMVSMLMPVLKAYRRDRYGEKVDVSATFANVSVAMPEGVATLPPSHKVT